MAKQTLERNQMNIIRNRQILILFLFFMSISCSQIEKKPKLNISSQFKEEWKSDSLGCLGYRIKYVKDSLNVIKKIIGMDYAVFEENFGKPFAFKENNNRKLYYYWISCSLMPKIKRSDGSQYDNLKKQNNDAEQLILDVDSNNIVQDIIAAKP